MYYHLLSMWTGHRKERDSMLPLTGSVPVVCKCGTGIDTLASRAHVHCDHWDISSDWLCTSSVTLEVKGQHLPVAADIT